MDLRVELFFSFCSCGLRTGEAKMRLKINFSKNKCLIVNRIYVPVRVRPSSFFLLLASCDRPKFLAFGKKKVTSYLNHFLLEIILFIWKMSILTAYRDKQEQKQEHFLHYNVHFVNPNMLMFTFNVFVLWYQGLLFRYFLCFFFFHVFSVRSIDPISLNAFDVKRKKGGGGGGGLT